MAVTASIVINFEKTDETSYLAVELDSEKNLGKTTFRQGDDIFFKVYSDIDYSIDVTSGTVVQTESDTESAEIKETLSFIKTKYATVQKKVLGNSISQVWYGSTLGDLFKSGVVSVEIDTAEAEPVGVCEITYKSEYDLWRLVPPAGMPDDYAIVILITA